MHHIRYAVTPVAARACMRNGTQNRNFFSRRNNWLMPSDFGLRDVDRTFNRMEREMNSIFRDFKNEFPFFHRGFLPMVNDGGNRYVPAIEAESEDGKNYLLKMDLGTDFAPEDVKVTLKDKTVTIHAKFEKKSEDGASRMYQEVTRQFTLPDNVKIEGLKSLFTPQGVLSIEAPLMQIEAEKKAPKEIPIEKEAVSN